MVDSSSLNNEALDKVINQLVASRGKRTEIAKDIVSKICAAVRTVFLEEHTMMEIEAPINICGKA